MLGIREVSSYIPSTKISTTNLTEKFNIDDSFIKDKTGFVKLSKKESLEDTSDLCIKAFKDLEKKSNFQKDDIQIVVLVTQNPDKKIPHTSAILHNKLGLGEDCVCFDISQGCAGYVHGLSIILSFMKDNNLTKGLLFTCDPYSKIIDEEDKNTSLIFGDAATVTFISDDPVYVAEKFTFGTLPNSNKHLNCEQDTLFMNGREVFNFAMRAVPNNIIKTIAENKLDIENIDLFILHQGSRYIIDMLIKKMQIPREKAPFAASEYGNTVSSSIPIILENNIDLLDNNVLLLCGFGVGLSVGSVILKKV